jgi:TolB protein
MQRNAILLCFGALLCFVRQGAAQAPPPTPAPVIEVTGKVRQGAGRQTPVAVPDLLAPGMAAVQARVVEPFTATLRADLEYAGAFTVTDPRNYPPTGFRDPSMKEAADRWMGGGAEVLVDARGEIVGARVSVEARVWDLKERKLIFGRRYSGEVRDVDRIAHTLANDFVKYFTGKDGLFLSSILFVSDRDGAKEIWAMDFDGRNPRRLTAHRSLTISPTARRGRAAYTSYVHTFPALWTMNAADGNDKKEIATGVELNASPTFSPDGAQIAFAGSAAGNTDIYVVNAAGQGLRRLTTTRALEASPDWSPTGRQILYTSDIGGTPQIYVMDAEGVNPRRLTYAGNWNDEGAWSPDSAKIAFACRNEGDFRICVMDVGTGRTVEIAGEGAEGHPTWSPDGEKIVYQSRRGGSTQVYTMDADGKNKRQLTQGGNNAQPVWIP